jgi:phage terminase small subunit
MAKDQPQALTKRQAKFVNEYLKDKNAVQAAIRAGYSPRSARHAALYNLKQPHVTEMLGIKSTVATESAEVDAAFVLRELKRVAEQEDVAQSTKVRALELIAKHLGMLEDRLSIKTDGLSAEQRAERVAVLIERASRRD